MHVTFSLLLLIGGILAAPSVQERTSCATLHIFGVRGTHQKPGEGDMAPIASAVTANITGADSVALVYPALWKPYYQESEGTGVKALLSEVKTYADRCPKSKIALLGYSQGGQVVMDTICGTSSTGFNATEPLSSSYSQKVVAVVAFGETGNVVGKSFDTGTDTTGDGIFPRTTTASCSAFDTTRIHSYCNSNDEFCASGTSLAVHESYVEIDGDAAVQFVIEQYNALK